MSADKYPSLFSRQMKAVVYLYLFDGIKLYPTFPLCAACIGCVGHCIFYGTGQERRLHDEHKNFVYGA